MSSSSSDSTTTTDPPSTLSSSSVCSTPTITSASGTYIAKTSSSNGSSSISVNGTNFTKTTTYKIASYNGTITYINPTSCTISLNGMITSGCLTLSNPTTSTASGDTLPCESQNCCFDLIETTAPVSTAPKLSVTSTDTTVVSGSTDNYYYYVFTNPGVEYTVSVVSDISTNDQFCIIACAGGGGGAGSNGASQIGGGGAGEVAYLTNVSASEGYTFIITVGSGGAGGSANKAGTDGEQTSIYYYDENSVPQGQLIVNPGGGGLLSAPSSTSGATSGGLGGKYVSGNITISSQGKNFGQSGNGGSSSNGLNLTYSNNPASVSTEFTTIPEELISIDGISYCYGGGGGGAYGYDGKSYSGGGGGTGGGKVTTTYGLQGTAQTSSSASYNGSDATYYGGGGGAGGIYIGYVEDGNEGTQLYNNYSGGAGMSGCVILFNLISS